jgi:hypothetical protein
LEYCRKLWQLDRDEFGSSMTFEAYLAMIREAEIHEENYQKRRGRPANWTEPTMTLEEAELDPLSRAFAKQMRDKGMTTATRTQYMMITHGSVKPYGWDQDAEDGIPQRLQDPYWRAYRNER